MMMAGLQSWWKGRTERRRIVAALYGAIMEQARHPWFFSYGGLPDTVEGRFEALALHAWLVMRRLATHRAASDARAISQALFDLMCADIDRALRELGVSDLKVGDQVKLFVSHYQGRIAAYETALADLQGDGAALKAALDRNFFGSALPTPEQVRALATYVRRQDTHLAEQGAANIVCGTIDFVAPC
jgi:cytochrome b pre-mRNA-processing protein 3